MGEVSLTRRVAAGAAIAATVAGALTLGRWWVAGWQRSDFSPDFGGPMAPLAAILVLVLGGATALHALWPATQFIRRLGLAAISATLVGALLAATQATLLSPAWTQWKKGSPDFLGFLPVGNMSILTIASLLLAAAGLMAALDVVPQNPGSWWRWVPAPVGLGLSGAVGLLYASGGLLVDGTRIVPMALTTAVVLAPLHLALLLLGPLGDVISRIRAHHAGPLPALARSFNARLAAAGGVIGLLILLAGILYVRREQANTRMVMFEQLDAITRLKAAQVSAWRGERMAEAIFLRNTPGVAKDISALVDRPADGAARQAALGWLAGIKGGERYQSIRVFEPSGRLLLSLPATASPSAPEALNRALSRSEIVFTDIHRNTDDPSTHFDLVVPIVPPPAARRGPAGKAVAAIVLRLDPRQSLFPLVETWPVHTQTGEVLLVHHQSGTVSYLNRPDVPARLATEAMPGAAGGLPPDHTDGAREARDYRGVLVLEAVQRIPQSPWILIAKIDRAEAFAPTRGQVAQTALLVALLLVSMALVFAFVARERQTLFLRRALAAERQGTTLAQRLALVTENANDVIFLFDPAMRIVEVNERVTSMHGWTPAEMKAMTLLDLHAPDARLPCSEAFARVSKGAGEVLETVHRRKDGSSLPVEISARPVTLGGEKYQLAIVRDITQRKAHEAEIQRLNRLYAALSQVNETIVRATQRDEFLNDVCDRLVKHGGFPMAWIAWTDPATGSISPVAQSGDRDGHLDRVRARSATSTGPAGRAIATNRPFSCADHRDEPAVLEWHSFLKEAGFSAALAVPIRISGSAVGALTVYTAEEDTFGAQETELIEEVAADIAFGLEALDVQKRRRDAESALRESEERLRLALAAAQQGLFDLDLRTGKAVVSPDYATMLGYDPETFTETNQAWLDRLHPDDREAVGAAFSEYMDGRRPDYRIEFRQRTASGAYKWILSLGRVVERAPDGTPLRMLGTHTDITERKTHEAEILAGQARLTATLDAIPDLMFELGLDGRYYAFHSPNTDLLAAPPEALIGRTVAELLPPLAAAVVLEALNEANAVGRSLGSQFELDLPVGRRWFELSVSRAHVEPGQGPRFIVLSRDITERKNAEQAMKASLREKEALLKEVHHRVKNNLQVITSLLRLETGRSSDQGTKLVLREMQGRIRSMALLHETLYRSGNFAQVDLAAYLRQLATQLFRGQNADPARIDLALDLAPTLLAIDQAIPCGLIVNELVTNAMKYAFSDGRKGEIRIVAGSQGGLIRLVVSDNGRGLPPDFDARRDASLGLQLVADLARQLTGDLDVQPSPAVFTITFPADLRRPTVEITRPPA
ncbi:MAG: PAS domain S-box protein [Vicinamibacteria bacterium]|nr:PAS domain S-box protein [Vicinamibacteria bacterium]